MAEGGTDRSMSETKNDPGDSGLYSRHSQTYVERVSLEICTVMTRLGYGEEIRRWRVEKYKEWDRLENARSSISNVQRITAGSKAEGLTSFYESDHDFLFVINGVLCVEDGRSLHTIPYDTEVYRMDTRVCPGHCKLFLERQAPTRFKVINKALCDNGNGEVLLSSGLFVDELLTLDKYRQYSHNARVVHYQSAGPSLPLSIQGIFQADMVTSLRCQCTSILQRWAARPRHWPSTEIVQKVVSFGAYLTPVGQTESENKHMDWRICFNTGEAELVNNLKDTHAKVYVLLKMILKNVLRPCKKEITSYVMKNIVLWQAENNPQSKFHARSLFHWLHDGLRELRTAIVTQQLSYYMIPERNLMAGSGLQAKQQIKWVADITDMMAEGPRVILRLPKIRQAVIASPEPLLWFNKRRMELEMLLLENLKINIQFRNENGVAGQSYPILDDTLQDISRRQFEIKTEVVQRMLVEGSEVEMLEMLTGCFRRFML